MFKTNNYDPGMRPFGKDLSAPCHIVCESCGERSKDLLNSLIETCEYCGAHLLEFAEHEGGE